MPTTAFDQAIHSVITAIARYRRCGPEYHIKSESYWVFIAGTYNRQKYEQVVEDALERLPAMKSFEDELRVARGLIVQAVRLLAGVHEEDSVDLAECMDDFDGC